MIAGCGEEGTRSPDNTDVSMLQGADSQGCTVDYGPLNQLRCHIRGKNSIFDRMILRFLSCPVTCMVSIVADGVPVPTGAFECGPESLDQARSCLVPSPRLLSKTRVLVLLCRFNPDYLNFACTLRFQLLPAQCTLPQWQSPASNAHTLLSHEKVAPICHAKMNLNSGR